MILPAQEAVPSPLKHTGMGTTRNARQLAMRPPTAEHGHGRLIRTTGECVILRTYRNLPCEGQTQEWWLVLSTLAHRRLELP